MLHGFSKLIHTYCQKKNKTLNNHLPVSVDVEQDHSVGKDSDYHDSGNYTA